jgi:hypothetical protein
MDACRDWVQKRLLPTLEGSIGKRMGTTTGWRIEVDPDVDDGQCLLFHYPGAFPPAEAGYVRPVVKIECGARSDDWPSESRTVTPYVADVFPEAVPDAAFQLSALAAERTFWEKAMLLHEETFARRKSRARSAWPGIITMCGPSSLAALRIGPRPTAPSSTAWRSTAKSSSA